MVCLLLVALFTITPGVSGQVALAAPVAQIALVIYHLTIHTRDLPHTYSHRIYINDGLHFAHCLHYKLGQVSAGDMSGFEPASQ